jgi:CubicO group peptidase (beta-lactamase class C family)
MGSLGSNIDQLLGSAVERGVVAGAAATVVDRDGVLHSGAAGAAGEETMYRNASMTKAPATVGALQLVERGLLDLDAPVESILPEFGTLQVLDGFEGEEPILRAPAAKATVRQLMNHTSGCGYYFGNAALSRYAQLAGVPSPLTGLKAALMGPLARDPGTRWEYGVSTDWLGLVVEALSGQPLDAYLDKHVYGPLGMSDSTFTLDADQEARLMDISLRTPEGGLTDIELELPSEPEWFSAGHGSCGTIGDYSRFIRAMLRDGELDGARVLAPATVAMAFTDSLGGVPLPELVESADPILTNDVPALPFKQGWGLGFLLFEEDVPGLFGRGTGSWSGIFNCYYWIDRGAGLGGVLMTQLLPFFDAGVVELLLGVQAAVYSDVAGGAPVPAGGGPA